MERALSALVTAHQQALSLAALGPSLTPLTGTLRGSEPRAIGRLASLVGDVVAHLETTPVDAPLHHVVAECNAALEVCLEAQREDRDGEGAASAVSEDLKRLVRLLAIVDGAEAPVIMRLIRRTLARLDVRR